MALKNPYYVYGTITDSGSPVNNAIVYTRDTTIGSSILNTTSNNDGKYMINLQTIAVNTDNIKVWAFYGGKYQQAGFVLNTSGAHRMEDLAISTLPASDTMSVSDSLIKASEIVSVDTISIADDLINSFAIPMDDTLMFSDGLIQDVNGVYVDTMNVSDGFIALFEIPTIADTMSLGDTSVSLFNIPASDSMNVSDDYLKECDLIVSDTMSVSDDLVSVATYLRNVSDMLAITDAYIKLFSSVFNDTLNITDDISLGIIVFYNPFDSLNIIDQCVRHMIIPLSDSMNISESLSQAVGLSFSDLFTFIDNKSSAAVYHRSIQDTLNILDGVNVQALRYFYIRSLNEETYTIKKG